MATWRVSPRSEFAAGALAEPPGAAGALAGGGVAGGLPPSCASCCCTLAKSAAICARCSVSLAAPAATS